MQKKQVEKEDDKKEEEKQDQEPQDEQPAEGEGDQPKPKPELVPAGYQEDVQNVSLAEEDGAFGKTDEPEQSKYWYNFEVYSKNTTRVDYASTTVGHLLISAIKQATNNETSSPEMHGVDGNLYELEKLLKEGFNPIDNTEYFKREEEEESKLSKSHSRSNNRSRRTEKSKVSSKSQLKKNNKSSNNSKPNEKIEAKEETLEVEAREVPAAKEFESPFHKLFDSVDRLSIQNYLLKTLDGSDMSKIEKLVLENLVIPGQNRENMPEHAELPLSVRKSDVNEMITFSTIGDQQMQRALILKDFETMMTDKESEREWKFFDRYYAKPLSKDALKYELSQSMLLNPEIATQYCAREDALLCALYFKNPPGRIIRNQWSLKYKDVPDFRGFLKSLLGEDQKVNPVHLDDQADTKFFNKDSLILCNEKRMYPSDNSVIRTIK